MPAPSGQAALGVLLPLAVALLVDQASKGMVLAWVMQPPRVIEVLPFFNLRLGFNEGAAFGMLGGVMAGRPLVMAALTGAVTAVIIVCAFRARASAERAGLGLVAGGALGNIADRLRQGAVTDFLDLHWRGWHWPAFNLADVAIAMGVLILLAAGVRDARRSRRTAHD